MIVCLILLFILVFIMSKATHLVYAGGTFGSHGSPLSPLPADIFLPTLRQILTDRLPNMTTQVLPNALIKDSSALTPVDFVALYGIILQAYAKGARRFVLITGTDSLSFLAAFLANAFANTSDISLIITGSMQPLLVANNADLIVNDDSDAWINLSDAIIATTTYKGVAVQFYHKLLDALNTQKLNSQDHDAFVGQPAILKHISQTPCFNVADALDNLPLLSQNAKYCQITAIYCLPNNTANLEHQLAHLSKHTKAVILIGFGAGNVPSSDGLVAQLEHLRTKQIPVISTTMCAFGGTNADYATGAWQYQHGVHPNTLGIAGIYGQTLWQLLQP